MGRIRQPWWCLVLLTILKPSNVKNLIQNQVRNGGGYSVPIRPSRWVYDKFKDDVHFYFMIAAIPIGMTVAAINLFVGPGELTPIPEGYVPREEEYHRNPITRFPR